MKSTIAFIFGLVFGLTTLAAGETSKSYEVKGMHCGGCAAAVKEKVCALPAITNCKVGLVKGKKNTGQISYDLKEGATLDEATLASTVKEAGDDYELITPKSTKPTKKK